MSEECSHNCNSCGADCNDRTQSQNFHKQPHQLSKIKKVIGVVSGKGGVGKSFVTSLLALHTNRKGKKTAILDADITGPSVPRMFGIKEKAMGSEVGIYPVSTENGIKIMSVNLLLENETDPVIWRGPILSGMVEQFWTDVIWDEIDVMFIDMPPGTGDVPLTVFQSIPLDGIVVVASPQGLVSMIVSKSVNMAEKMNVPVLGIVENMSYYQCPDCGKRHSIFGESHVEVIARDYGITTIAKLPIEPEATNACDNGKIEDFYGESTKCIDEVFDII